MTRRLSSNTQTMRAVERLRQLLVEGAFAPGERLLEQTLVDRLGVSRSPLRLALTMLQHEGLVERLPTGGHAARAFTSADLADIMDLRGMIEGAAARRAAERRSRDAGTLERMRQACRAMEVALSSCRGPEAVVPYFKHDRVFHSLILQLAGSLTVTRSLEMLKLPSLPQVLPDRMLRPPTIQGLLVMQSQHVALLDAIERGEGVRAESIVREHWFRFRNAFQSQVA